MLMYGLYSWNSRTIRFPSPGIAARNSSPMAVFKLTFVMLPLSTVVFDDGLACAIGVAEAQPAMAIMQSNRVKTKHTLLFISSPVVQVSVEYRVAVLTGGENRVKKLCACSSGCVCLKHLRFVLPQFPASTIVTVGLEIQF